MANSDKYRNHYHRDLLVIGSNLTALLCAEQARQNGQNVTLLVPDERLQLGPSVEFLPDSTAAHSAIDWLRNLLTTELRAPEFRATEFGATAHRATEVCVEKIESTPVTFEEGQLKPFLGFGDRQVKSVDELSAFTTTSRLKLTPSLGQLGQMLANLRQGLMAFRKEPTRLLHLDGKLQGIEVNGEELWTASKVILASDLEEFLHLMPNEVLDSRARSKITRQPLWSTLTVRFEHRSTFALPQRFLENGDPSALTAPPVHLLTGGSQDFEPILGFFEATPLGLTSNWVLLIAADHTEDHDHLGQAVKHIKRQIKRIYIDALDDLRDEKLSLAGRNLGHLHLKLRSDFTLPELSGLILALPLLSQQKGWLALLDQAQKLTQKLTVEQPTSGKMSADLAANRELSREGPAREKQLTVASDHPLTETAEVPKVI